MSNRTGILIETKPLFLTKTIFLTHEHLTISYPVPISCFYFWAATFFWYCSRYYVQNA